MQEDINGEELLSLGLGLSSGWHCQEETKKRKRCGDNDDNTVDNELTQLIHARNRMLRADPESTIHGMEDGKAGLQLIHLLLLSATAVDSNNTITATNSLTQLYRHVSLHGDPIQRVAAYFADGLTARLLFTQNPILFSAVMSEPTPEQELVAYIELYQASPYYQFAHFTANQAILEAFEEAEGSSILHIVDLDVSYGFQWPSLIQSLADKATDDAPISLHITGFGRSVEDLKETGTQLTNFVNVCCCCCCNLAFEFNGLLRGQAVRTVDNATLIVNSVFYPEISETFASIRSLSPSAVVLVEKEGKPNAQSFLSGFIESLHYFAAMFDSLDDCLPAESAARLWIESSQLGREIKSAVVVDRHFECGSAGTLKEMMEGSGFEAVRLSSRSVSQAKLLLRLKSYCSYNGEYGGNSGGFRVFERDWGRAISLGWQERHLVTASAWRNIE